MSGTTDSGFGSRLRAERERRKITLSSIAENTKISVSLLEGLEREDVSRWPCGIFRRSFIRAYAKAVGLDQDAIAREFLERFPDPAEPIIPLAPSPPAPGAGAPAAIPPVAERRAAFASHVFSSRMLGLRLKVADAGAAFVRGRLLPEVPRRWAAAMWDAAVLVAIGTLLFIGLQQFWMPFALVTLGYYIGSIVLLGNTPGVSLFGADDRREGS